MSFDSIRTERAGTIAGIAVLLIALPTLLIWGDGMWFFLDEWSFLANRRLPTIDGFLAAHNGHWVTLPLIAYRVNFELFGLHTYLPYQLLVVLSHLTVAGLGHVIMRRMGVRAWLATAIMVGFVFYGAGYGNIIFGFQITLNGSVIAGLVQMLCADHDGRWSRRDTVGLCVALLGLMTSAVFPAMAVGVGAFVLIRRRDWRIAARHTVVPAAVFGLWYAFYGSSSGSDPGAWPIAQFVYHAFLGTFEGLAQSTPGGVALAFIAVLGGVTAWQSRGDDERMRVAAYPAGLAVAAFAFAALSGFNRSGLAEELGISVESVASSGRYLHVMAALLVPITALGAQRLFARWRPLVLVPVALIALALPAATEQIRELPPFSTGDPDQVAALAHSELIDQVPVDFMPLPFQDVRAGWLDRAAVAGDIPEPSAAVTPARQLAADAILALTAEATAELACSPVEGSVDITAAAGTRVFVDSPATMALTRGEIASPPRQVPAGSTIRVQAGPVDLRVTGQDGAPLTACVVTPG